MIGEEILLEIDETLDRLIQNAEAIGQVDPSDLSDVEIDAFQKTQESLLHHLIHMDEELAAKQVAIPDKRSSRYRIQEKRSQFERLKQSYHATLAEARRPYAMMPKRRAKRLLVPR
jgi:hypothetical protein